MATRTMEQCDFEPAWWVNLQGDGPIFTRSKTRFILNMWQRVCDARENTGLVKDIVWILGSVEGQKMLALYPRFMNNMIDVLYNDFYCTLGVYKLQDWWIIMFRCDIEDDRYY